MIADLGQGIGSELQLTLSRFVANRDWVRQIAFAAHSDGGGAAMNRRKLLQRILQGFHQNVSYSDVVNLLAGLGFQEARTRGSHHIFHHPSIPQHVNLQPWHGQTKAYEIRQILRLIRLYNLKLEDEP